MPVPYALAPPQNFQVICETRPVGSPPLKILDGRTWPKPSPWAKTPAGRPSVGTAVCCWLGPLAHPAQISTAATPSQRQPPRIAPTAPPFHAIGERAARTCLYDCPRTGEVAAGRL